MFGQPSHFKELFLQVGDFANAVKRHYRKSEKKVH